MKWSVSADPTLNNDLNFSRSVVILVEENNVGYVGFIINKKSIYSTLDLIPEIKENFEIFDGGPVEKENLYFIHNVPDLIKNSIEIKGTFSAHLKDGVALSKFLYWIHNANNF